MVRDQTWGMFQIDSVTKPSSLIQMEETVPLYIMTDFKLDNDNDTFNYIVKEITETVLVQWKLCR